MAKGWRTGPPGYIGWRAGTTTLCQSRLYPPVRDYEFAIWQQIPAEKGGEGEKVCGVSRVCTCGDDGILTVDL